MTELRSRKPKHSFNLRSLRLSLKYRPEILELILRLKLRLRQKQIVIQKLKYGIEEMVNENRYKDVSSVKELVDTGTNTDIIVASTDTANDKDQPKQTKPDDISKPEEIEPINSKSIETKNQTTQTEEIVKKTRQKDLNEVLDDEKPEDSGWNINDNKETKSIAEQVAEAAQDAMKESGMVYVESAGMYYDYKTGYYYNSELGLYYHTDTECYYYYSEDKKTFVFHSYPDRSSSNAALLAHEKRKARKHKMERKTEEDIDNLTKNLSQVSLRGQAALGN
ncbi:hypothetical protein PYW08_005595 [Mythimna loreyi]|uniref:Uncharacterized protein n=1 Tax=Mythimna loreyi TaxID=667449 RepID=A0ACC2QHF9_9NEOP|nr:hypothetical protein PYW08_005595 [Mythimna loreyi]